MKSRTFEPAIELWAKYKYRSDWQLFKVEGVLPKDKQESR